MQISLSRHFSLIVKQLREIAFTAFTSVRKRRKSHSFKFLKMVGVLGLEPRTSSLSGTRSNQLSYTPIPQKVAYPSATGLGSPLRGTASFRGPRSPAFRAALCAVLVPASIILFVQLLRNRDGRPHLLSCGHYARRSGFAEEMIFPPHPHFFRLAADARVRGCSLSGCGGRSRGLTCPSAAPTAPVVPGCNIFLPYSLYRKKMVEVKGLEPSTSCLQSRYSSH